MTDKEGPMQAFPNSVARPIVPDKYETTRRSLTYMSNNVTCKSESHGTIVSLMLEKGQVQT